MLAKWLPKTDAVILRGTHGAEWKPSKKNVK